jgi:predicted dehydrogenase
LALDSTRRHFFLGTLLAGAVPAAGFGSVPSLKQLGYKSPNEKLNIAAIGAGGKGASDINGCSTENIVALCDVDEKQAAGSFKKYEKAARYKDFRQMLDKEKSNIDAVIVATPDHMHATAAHWAIERRKHVYCQKPLVRTVWEARQLQAAAHKYGVATQMGNQGYSGEGTRQAAEIVWSGGIGDVTDVYAWTNRPIWPQGLTDVPAPSAVPATLDWDLWLGIAENRPYTSGGAGYPNDFGGNFYQPFNWRGFYDFGCGALGDMACHILGAPNMALRLGPPTSVECIKRDGTSSFMFPRQSVIRFEFPARGNMPALKLTWYDGMREDPEIVGVPKGEFLGDLPPLPRQTNTSGEKPRKRPTGYVGGVFNYDDYITAYKDYAPDTSKPKSVFDGSNGSLFVGTKGLMTTGTYGDNTRLLPVEKMKDYRFPAPELTRSPGHYHDWIRACKGGDPACSNFDVAAPFVEWMLLGVIALRVEGKLQYDAAKARFTNNNEANKYLKPTFRKGWKFA